MDELLFVIYFLAVIGCRNKTQSHRKLDGFTSENDGFKSSWGTGGINDTNQVDLLRHLNMHLKFISKMKEKSRRRKTIAFTSILKRLPSAYILYLEFQIEGSKFKLRIWV